MSKAMRHSKTGEKGLTIEVRPHRSRLDGVPARWSPQRKAIAVRQAKQDGIYATALRYHLSEEELGDWVRAFDARGIAGLCITKRIARRT